MSQTANISSSWKQEAFLFQVMNGLEQILDMATQSGHNIIPIGEQLPKKDWKKTEQAWVKIGQRIMSEIAGGWSRDEKGNYIQKYPNRKVLIGTSQVALAWTDGVSYVTFARQFLAGLKMFKDGAPNVEAFMKFANVLLHEMCHDIDSRDNIHSPDFYRDFHDRSLELGKAVSAVMKYMTPAMYKKITGEFDADDDSTMELEGAELDMSQDKELQLV